MNVKILGSGCKRCRKLETNVRKAIEELDQEASIEKVQDFEAIAAYDVLQTPALVVDEKVVISGKVPSAKAIAKLLS